MEGGRKAIGSSSSSFSSDLFGVKGSSSSSANADSSPSTGIFDSVFSPPSTILGREYSRSEVIGSWKNQDFDHQVSNSKQRSPGKTSQNREGENRGILNNGRNSIFQDQTAEPCYLSSSLYYGGQDIYSNPSNTQASELPHIFKRDVDDNDPSGNNLNSASRGNWWEGSLYY